MKIAVDAMGGDYAPAEIVRGVADAIQTGVLSAEEVVLVGHPDYVGPVMDDTIQGVDLIGATQTVEMDESPAATLRNKPESSIQVALRLVQGGQADAFVSAGNTGAVVACAVSLLGRLPGVRRPGIAVTFASTKGPVTILDVGANVHCKPLHLYQYGVMAEIFSRDVLGIEAPRVALLNIGEEEAKGNSLVKETRALFAKSDLNFIGNIEGNHLLAGQCNVVVCEGFVGNVVLKVLEGVGLFLHKTIADQLGASGDSAANDSSGAAMKALLSKFDYAEYGGAPLLGVSGLCMIMHGRSDRRATANALRVSRQFVEAKVNEHILRAIKEGVVASG